MRHPSHTNADLSQDQLQRMGFAPHWNTALAARPNAQPVRIARIDRSRALAWSATDQDIEIDLALYPAKHDLAVGDWLLIELADGVAMPLERLQRHGCVQRRAAGERADQQLIAANLDTLFIVSSCNTDFSLERLERYLALALDARVEPVIVLTKADQCDSPQDYADAATALRAGLCVETVDARDDASVARLNAWCGAGQTVALVGSSGVGKSTLINALCDERQDTQLAREGDDKGRHTTTARSLHWLRAGGLIIDTPGMRELQLPACADGLEALFEDVTVHLGQCRFNDCAHQGEPGCAIAAAIASGELDERRWHSYSKLQREQADNARSIADRKASDKTLTRSYKRYQREARGNKGKR